MTKIGTVTLGGRQGLTVDVEKFSVVCESNSEVWIEFACMLHESYPSATDDEEAVVVLLSNPGTWTGAVELKFRHASDADLVFDSVVIWQNRLGNIEDKFTGGVFRLRTLNSSSMHLWHDQVEIHRNPRVEKNKIITVEHKD